MHHLHKLTFNGAITTSFKTLTLPMHAYDMLAPGKLQPVRHIYSTDTHDGISSLASICRSHVVWYDDLLLTDTANEG